MKNNQNVLISLLCLIVILFITACNSPKQAEEVEEDSIENYLQASKTFGKFITPEEALNEGKNYIQFRGNNGRGKTPGNFNPAQGNYRFDYDIKIIHEFMQRIKTYNMKNPNDSIYGVRVILGARKVPKGKGNFILMRDNYLVPFNKEGKLLYDSLNSFFGHELLNTDQVMLNDSSLILNSSGFCPPCFP